VALDDLGGAEAGAPGNVGEIEAEARVVTGRNAPTPTGDRGSFQVEQKRLDCVLQIRMAELQGIVVHHEGAKGRHHLDNAGKPGGVQLLPQCQDERAQMCIDAVAELDHESRIAGGEEAGLWGRWHMPHHLVSGHGGAPHHCMVFP
jgi:hypothetical protein